MEWTFAKDVFIYVLMFLMEYAPTALVKE